MVQFHLDVSSDSSCMMVFCMDKRHFASQASQPRRGLDINVVTDFLNGDYTPHVLDDGVCAPEEFDSDVAFEQASHGATKILETWIRCLVQISSNAVI